MKFQVRINNIMFNFYKIQIKSKLDNNNLIYFNDINWCHLKLHNYLLKK